MNTNQLKKRKYLLARTNVFPIMIITSVTGGVCLVAAVYLYSELIKTWAYNLFWPVVLGIIGIVNLAIYFMLYLKMVTWKSGVTPVESQNNTTG